MTRLVNLLPTLRAVVTFDYAWLASGLLARLWPDRICTGWIPFLSFKKSSVPPFLSNQAYPGALRVHLWPFPRFVPPFLLPAYSTVPPIKEFSALTAQFRIMT